MVIEEDEREKERKRGERERGRRGVDEKYGGMGVDGTRIHCLGLGLLDRKDLCGNRTKRLGYSQPIAVCRQRGRRGVLLWPWSGHRREKELKENELAERRMYD